MGKFITIFFVFVLFVSTLAALPEGDDMGIESLELSDRTNGTTKTINVDASQKVILQCSRQGYKNIKVGWFLEERRLDTEDEEGPYVSTSSLQVQNFNSLSSKLVYTCRTEDSTVNLWARIEINVNEEIGILQYSLELTEISSSQPSKLVIPPPKTAEVICFFQDMSPPDIGWYLDGVRLQTQDSKLTFVSYSKLRVSSEMLNPTGKKYTCRSGESTSTVFAVVEISSEDIMDPEDQIPAFYKDLSMIAITMLPALIFCFLICVTGICYRVIRNRQPKKEIVGRNLARDSRILVDETYYTLEKSHKPLIAHPEIPSVHSGNSATSQSYYHINIGHRGLKTSDCESKDNFGHTQAGEHQSY